MYQGDNTATVQHEFRADSGDIDLCKQAGDVTIGGVAASHLYLDGLTSPSLFLREGATATSYTTLYDSAAGGYLEKYEATGSATLYIAPKVGDGTSAARINMFLATSTSGTRDLRMFEGDGTSDVQHQFDVGTGVVNLCQQAGTIQQNGVNVALSTDVGAGTDTTAIHDNVANEITAITAKTTLVNADEFVLEDSAASYVKKAVTANNLATYTNKYNVPRLVETTSGITTGYPKWVKVMSTTTRYTKLIADVQNGLYSAIYQWSERITVHCDDATSAPTVTWVRNLEDATTGTVNVAWNFEVWYDSSTGDTELWAKAANQHARMAVEAWKQYHWNTDPDIVRSWETAISSTGPTAAGTYSKVWDTATATPNFDFDAYSAQIRVDGTALGIAPKTTAVTNTESGYLGNTAGAWATLLSVASGGPYLIQSIICSYAAAAANCKFRLTVDGTVVYTESAYKVYSASGQVLLGPGSIVDLIMQLPCRTSFLIEYAKNATTQLKFRTVYQAVTTA